MSMEALGTPLVVAHRGGTPENKLAAFRQAVKIGASAVELDIHPTRDGQLVVIHDETLDRTTGGKGRVADLDLADVHKWDVPTLAEVLDVTESIVTLIEIKQPDHGPRYQIEEPLVALLRERKALEKVVVISFDRESLIRLHELEPSLATGFLYASPQDLAQVQKELSVRYLGPHHQLVTREMMEEAHRFGLKVNPWTVNDPARMRELLDLGVDALTTDRAELLLPMVR